MKINLHKSNLNLNFASDLIQLNMKTTETPTETDACLYNTEAEAATSPKDDIRARNEAIADTISRHTACSEALNLTPGADPLALPSDSELASIFSLRQSVWP